MNLNFLLRVASDPLFHWNYFSFFLSLELLPFFDIYHLLVPSILHEFLVRSHCHRLIGIFDLHFELFVDDEQLQSLYDLCIIKRNIMNDHNYGPILLALNEEQIEKYGYLGMLDRVLLEQSV